MTVQGMSIWQLWFSFRGRASRSVYWLGLVVPSIVIYVLLVIADHAVGTLHYIDPTAQPIGIMSAVFSIFMIWPNLAVGAKRCHDRDRTGWFQLILLIPIIGPIWYVIYVGFLPGTQGHNRFGPDPLLRDQAGGAPVDLQSSPV